MVFGPVKKYRDNVYISLKTEYKVIYLKTTAAATGGVKKEFLKNLQISQEKNLLACNLIKKKTPAQVSSTEYSEIF